MLYNILHCDPLTPILTVSQLRSLVTKIASSPQRRFRFRETSAKIYKNTIAPNGTRLADLMVVRDVATRWNYTHAMIKRARLLQRAVDRWARDREETQCLVLSTDEWDLLGQIEKMLEVCLPINVRLVKIC